VFSFMVTNNGLTLTLSFQIQSGFALYLVALFTSYLATYLILTVQRRTVLKIAPKDLEDTERISISGIFFEKRLVIIGPLLVFLVHLISFLLILFGINLTAIKIFFGGTLQQLLTQIQFIPTSIFLLLNNVITPTPVILGITQAVRALFYIVVIAFPIIHILLLAFLWFVPLPITYQGTAFTITEIFSAWSSLDVFIISFEALITSLPVVAQLVAGQACAGLANFINFPPQAQCLTTVSAVDAGISLTIIGSIVYVVAANVILRIATNVIQYRIRGGVETEKRKFQPDNDAIGSDGDYGTAPEESYESAQSYSFGSKNNRSINSR